MTNDAGKRIGGIMTPDRVCWKSDTPLGYDRTYRLAAVAQASDGKRHSDTATFATLGPSHLTKPYLTTTGGGAIIDGATYGVGMVAVVRFDEAIPDRAAAQRRLSVQTEPGVDGAWSWLDDRHVHFRPRDYYAPGTKITLRANVYGANLGNGVFGQEDASVSYVIGDSHVSIADDDTKHVDVYRNGTLVRSMPTSMGMGGSEVVGDNTISFWTQRGIYTVLDKANPVVMDSSTFGLPINSWATERPSTTPPESATMEYICTSTSRRSGRRETPMSRTAA
jgi:lipoprotein-anchoring transpeptidase ErfK/SrfK